MSLHPSITADRVCNACLARETSLNNPGICIACGEDQEGCEPDAAGYKCESCGQHTVYGAEELLLRFF